MLWLSYFGASITESRVIRSINVAGWRVQSAESDGANLLDKHLGGEGGEDASHHSADGAVGDGVPIHRHLDLHSHCNHHYHYHYHHYHCTWCPYRYWNMNTRLSVGRMLWRICFDSATWNKVLVVFAFWTIYTFMYLDLSKHPSFNCLI